MFIVQKISNSVYLKWAVVRELPDFVYLVKQIESELDDGLCLITLVVTPDGHFEEPYKLFENINEMEIYISNSTAHLGYGRFVK